jgi:4'-phosphopantetheinyl transferase
LEIRDEAHVWLVDPAVADVGERLARYQALMDDDDRLRQRRFVFEPDRRAFAVTRALVRTALSQYAAVAPGSWCFARSDHGRPLVTGPPEGLGLSFSVTHTRGLIACLITRHPRAAIDVEALQPVDDALQIATQYFAAREVAALAAQRGVGRDRLFLALWTLKEAYLKARGRGLTLPLDSATFSLGEGEEKGTIDAVVDNEGGDIGFCLWTFQLLRPSSTHILALARSHVTADSPDVKCFRMIPLEEEEAIVLPMEASGKTAGRGREKSSEDRPARTLS